MKAIVLPHNTLAYTTEVPSDLATLQGLVGGYIEAIHSTVEGHKIIVLVDEDGAAKGLPINPTASYLAQKKFIVGNAVVFGTYTKDGEFSDVPDDIAEAHSNPLSHFSSNPPKWGEIPKAPEPA